RFLTLLVVNRFFCSCTPNSFHFFLRMRPRHAYTVTHEVTLRASFLCLAFYGLDDILSWSWLTFPLGHRVGHIHISVSILKYSKARCHQTDYSLDTLKVTHCASFQRPSV